MQVSQTLDARGLSCPLPIIRTKKALTALEPGQILKVVASDPGAVSDIPSFCSETGHSLLNSEKSEAGFEFFIRRK